MAVRQIWINGEEKLDQFEFIVPLPFRAGVGYEKGDHGSWISGGEGGGRPRHVFGRRRSHQPGQRIPADDGTGAFKGRELPGRNL